jgi:hypothetical protein
VSFRLPLELLLTWTTGIGRNVRSLPWVQCDLIVCDADILDESKGVDEKEEKIVGKCTSPIARGVGADTLALDESDIQILKTYVSPPSFP